MITRCVVLTLFLAAAGCVTADDCALRVPDAQRADAIRFALDRGLVAKDFVPREHYSLALGAGRPYDSLTEEERTKLAPHAAAYATCIRETVNKSRWQ